MNIYDEYVHLVRMALEGQKKDVLTLAKRNLKQITKIRPDLAETLKVMIDIHGNATVVRASPQQPVPIDIDSKLELLRKEVCVFEDDPVWPENVSRELNAVIEERKHEANLLSAGLTPTRSLLFVGPPGVGKTLAAKWLSFQLGRPLYTLDLAAVMSSFLGRTGNNIRAVLNYAQKTPSVLLLDEFDAVAKRRDDDTEVGELKRLVTVLLQSVDEWPSKGILISATNHPELLDHAVWRRFERIIEFPNPSIKEIQHTILELLSGEKIKNLQSIIKILTYVFEGMSFSEIVRQINNARRESIIRELDLSRVLTELVERQTKELERSKKIGLALTFLDAGISQRKVSEITGLSRDTLRKHVKRNHENEEMGAGN